MRADTLDSQLMAGRMTGLRVVRWATFGAGGGAIGGTIFGIIFAGFLILFGVESYGSFGVTSYFAASGMAAGAVLGVWGALLDIEIPAEPTEGTCRRCPSGTPLETDSLWPPTEQRKAISGVVQIAMTTGSSRAECNTRTA